MEQLIVALLVVMVGTLIKMARDLGALKASFDGHMQTSSEKEIRVESRLTKLESAQHHFAP